jgi:hypothetical protein
MTGEVYRDEINAKQAAERDYRLRGATPPDWGQLGTANSQGQGIGWAIKQMHHGLKIRRMGWNGKGMWLALQVPDLNSKMTMPYVYMRIADGNLVPWLCSQTDLLAWDWEIATAE